MVVYRRHKRGLAAKLKVNVYEEIEADATAMNQAAAVVVLFSLAAGIGSMQQGGAVGIAWGTIMALIGRLVWSYLTCLFGTRVLPGPETRATYGELLRTIGFRALPG